MTLLEIADKFPPCLCRFLARKKHGHQPLSVRDLAELSGLSKSTVAVLSLKRSWKGVPIDVVVRFTEACGVNLMRSAEVRKYIRRSRRVYLENASPQQKRFFLKLFTQRG